MQNERKGEFRPCVVGHQEHVRGLMTRVNEAVNKKNEFVYRLSARHGMNKRQADTQVTTIASWVVVIISAVRSTKKEMKSFMRRNGREWWLERANELNKRLIEEDKVTCINVCNILERTR